ncbi:MAG TPA: hypothetical protein VG839_08270 [Asticcacaulis sp.]|nr:hypothetical protein [Asticcacaulis sp.]
MTFHSLPIWLFGLQVFHVAFLLLHDWVPLGPFNNLKAQNQHLKLWQRIVGPVISAILPGIGLYLSLSYTRTPYPWWLNAYLIGAYTFLFVGEIEAWWATYFWGYKRERGASYQAMLAGTVSFLPLRNGIAPNAIHVLLHLATVATLVLLIVQASTSLLKL